MRLQSLIVSLLSTLPTYLYKSSTHFLTEKKTDKTLSNSIHVHIKGLPNSDTQSLLTPTAPEGHNFDFSDLDDISVVVPIEIAAGPLNKDLIASNNSSSNE